VSAAEEEYRRCMLGLCIWREARGETTAGMLAVGQVIENRVSDSRWPDTYQTVITQPWQFSAFNKDDPNSQKWPEGFGWGWRHCWSAAKRVIDEDEDFAGGANHYCTPAVNPAWAQPDKLVKTIGGHRFYRL
jgi:N-acetylmuramoyl-L-alanine amidase